MLSFYKCISSCYSVEETTAMEEHVHERIIDRNNKHLARIFEFRRADVSGYVCAGARRAFSRLITSISMAREVERGHCYCTPLARRQ